MLHVITVYSWTVTCSLTYNTQSRPHGLLVNTIFFLCRDLERVQMRETCPYHLDYYGWSDVEGWLVSWQSKVQKHAACIMRDESRAYGQSRCVRRTVKTDQCGEVCTAQLCNLGLLSSCKYVYASCTWSGKVNSLVWMPCFLDQWFAKSCAVCLLILACASVKRLAADTTNKFRFPLRRGSFVFASLNFLPNTHQRLSSG